MERLCRAAVTLAHEIARGEIAGDHGSEVGTNIGGDGQKALDVLADDLFSGALRGSAVCHYASEEQDSVVSLGETGSFGIAIDPLDGSSNIGVNISIGTIFALYPAAETPEATFLRRAGDLIAAGYFIYGPQCCLVVSFGAGTQKYTLDPQEHRFILTAERLEIPASTGEFAINTSNYNHWPKPIRLFIDDLMEGQSGPRGRAFNMRWIASLVAETHRILTRGGVFLYPGDMRPGYERGRLRLLYECAPIAFLVTQAQGAATDGMDPILSQPTTALHQRTPFVFGSANKVARITTYHDLADRPDAALFSKRGLFRSTK
ncbi:MAG: fructose-bisphosphatase class I [Rhodobacterales bacterium 17-64-5]|nr:MAG: fructose-bisphosphatase class I [Rhodobacterales bacterium 17-64-5]